MQVIGYTRVSTEDQAREGVSLGAQRVKIEAYTLVKGWTLVEMIRDKSVSAKILVRPSLQRLLALVDAGDVQAIIVYKLDRLTRNMADLNKLMKLFERKG
jgi:site-specific DNA recombinase